MYKKRLMFRIEKKQPDGWCGVSNYKHVQQVVNRVNRIVCIEMRNQTQTYGSVSIALNMCIN